MATMTNRELYELKQHAMEYYSDNGVPAKIEEILNNMFYDKPDDVYGHLAAFFDANSNPATVTKVKAQTGIDSRGQPTLLTNVYCSIRNAEKLVCSSLSSNSNPVPDHARIEEKDIEIIEMEKEMNAALEYINATMSEQLKDVEPTQQKKVDEIISEIIKAAWNEEEERLVKDAEANPDATEAAAASSPRPQSVKGKKSPKGKKGAPVVVIPDEPKERLQVGCSAICGLSKAICEAAAMLKHVPLYQHIAELKTGEVKTQFRIPQPMVAIMSGAKASPAKVNCVKEYMVIPRPSMPLKESIPAILQIFQKVNRGGPKAPSAKAAKGAPPADAAQDVQALFRMVNDVGIICPNLDRPEQGIEMIQDAITQLGLTPGVDFHIALNCAAHEIFDYEKGKYEVVTGILKEPEGMVDFWAEIVQKYPSVIALLDPIRSVEREPWIKLCERLSPNCYIGGEAIFKRPGIVKDEEPSEEFKTSAYVMKQKMMNSVSDILKAAETMQERNNVVILGTNKGETSDSSLADMAVGCAARFLMVGGPCRGERIAKLNRLIAIEDELENNGMLDRWDEYAFPNLTPPPPPAPIMEENEEEVKESAEEKTGSPTESAKNSPRKS